MLELANCSVPTTSLNSANSIVQNLNGISSAVQSMMNIPGAFPASMPSFPNPLEFARSFGQTDHMSSTLAAQTGFGSDINGLGFTSGAQENAEEDFVKDLLQNIPHEDEFIEEDMIPVPRHLSVQLLKHQRMGVTWMKKCEDLSQHGGILADDMGLGKTVQAIALMLANRSEDDANKTNLIVGPVSLLRQWGTEFDEKIKRGGRFSYYIFHQQNRARSFRELQRYDAVLISYNTLTSEFKKHFRTALEELKAAKRSGELPDHGTERYKSPFYSSESHFYRIILDEAQSIKNKLTYSSRACARLENFWICVHIMMNKSSRPEF
ncbi:unnamed protein product [Ambrosiozyma monospora]|uniref:Unnamed protein product n=1 Tax=Ambrosiozyma monospora TaxID=43982 RepID=A0ACB5U8C1_AMBMO|nr:unnamed protein product [Ambrosiozyma monospora]